MNRWKLFLILILAVILIHIIVIKIFIIGSSDASENAVVKSGEVSPAPEPPLPREWRK